MTDYVKDIQNKMTSEDTVREQDSKSQVDEKSTKPLKTRTDFVREMLKSSKSCRKKNKDELLVGFLNNCSK